MTSALMPSYTSSWNNSCRWKEPSHTAGIRLSKYEVSHTLHSRWVDLCRLLRKSDQVARCRSSKSEHTTLSRTPSSTGASFAHSRVFQTQQSLCTQTGTSHQFFLCTEYRRRIGKGRPMKVYICILKYSLLSRRWRDIPSINFAKYLQQYKTLDILIQCVETMKKIVSFDLLHVR